MNVIYHLDHHPERPAPVTSAVYLLLAYLALSALVYIGRTAAFLLTSAAEYPPGFWLGNVLANVVGYLVQFIVLVKIAQGRNWARWLLVVGLVLALSQAACNMTGILAGDVLLGILTLAEVVVVAVAVGLLFQRAASPWFTAGRETEAAAP